MERTLMLKTEPEMEALGERIARALPLGGFVALDGDLGAGKTVLCRGAGRALGLNGHLSSPTFTIVQEYPTVPLLFHFDAYRLADEDELYAMGYEDYLDRNGLILMEWGGPGARRPAPGAAGYRDRGQRHGLPPGAAHAPRCSV